MNRFTPAAERAATSLFIAKFTVLGDPTPQGSKTKMPNGAMLEGSSPDQRARRVNWRNAVATEAADIADATNGPHDGDLSLVVSFRFPMPKSRNKAQRLAGVCWKNSAPDLDKLIRSVGDSLKAGGLITDDARIVAITATKLEVVGWTGATIELWRAEPLTERAS